MIRITVKVKNDHAFYSEKFEIQPPVTLDQQDPYIKSIVEKCIKEFNQSHEEVIIKTTWEA